MCESLRAEKPTQIWGCARVERFAAINRREILTKYVHRTKTTGLCGDSATPENIKGGFYQSLLSTKKRSTIHITITNQHNNYKKHTKPIDMATKTVTSNSRITTNNKCAAHTDVTQMSRRFQANFSAVSYILVQYVPKAITSTERYIVSNKTFSNNI